MLILAMVCFLANPISTTRDGAFQAIAQSPTSINLYLLQQPHSQDVYADGRLIAQAPPGTGSFSCTNVSSLIPNNTYTFSLGESGPKIAEKTWANVPREERFDLLVIGGTASGVSAAVTGARLGLRVALIEQTNRLGGMASNGLGSTDLRDPSHANGFFDDFRQRVKAFYREGDGLKYEPRVANAIMKSMVYEQPNITLFLRTELVRPVVAAGRVCGAEVMDSVTGKRGVLYAGATIDATDTADLAAAAGAAFVAGREPRSPEEPHAGVIYFDDAAQQILPGSTGQADTKQQSYAYLMIWKDFGPDGAPPIERPAHYDPETYRYSPDWDQSWNASSGKLPNGKYEINQHPFGIDWPGINYDYPIASPMRRREIESLCRDRALGYLYFMQNERGHKNLGLADDEFLDNSNFPVSLYVREARRLRGEQVLLENEVTEARTFHRLNSIAIADYPMDSHATEDLKDPNRLDKGEGEMWLAQFTPWSQVPYGVMVPCGVDGLLVTTAVSATHVAYGTVRMEPVRMSLGQAAAAAAYWSKLYGIPLRAVNPAWIQDKILAQGAYINWNSDVNADTRHFVAINFLESRGMFAGEAFRPNEAMTAAEARAALDQMVGLEGYGRALPLTVPAMQEPPSSEVITRTQFAQMLVEAKRRVDPTWNCVQAAGQSYADVPISSPYFEAVEILREHWITAMLLAHAEPGYFRPDEPISRADAAEAIYLAHRPYAMNYWRP